MSHNKQLMCEKADWNSAQMNVYQTLYNDLKLKMYEYAEKKIKEVIKEIGERDAVNGYISVKLDTERLVTDTEENYNFWANEVYIDTENDDQLYIANDDTSVMMDNFSIDDTIDIFYAVNYLLRK